MDVSATSQSTALPVADPTAFSQNEDRFRSLTAKFANANGDVSQDDRLQAYQDLFAMGATAQLRGIDGDDRKLFDQIIITSDIGQRAQQLQEQEAATVSAAVARGNSAAQAQLSFFDSLSGSDQKVHFGVTANPTDRSGSKAYANIESYHATLLANAQLDNYLSDAKAKGTDPASDSTLAGALRLVNSNRPSAEVWTAQIRELFGANIVKDKIDLSREAKRTVGAVADPSSPSSFAPYKEGSIASTIA